MWFKNLFSLSYIYTIDWQDLALNQWHKKYVNHVHLDTVHWNHWLALQLAFYSVGGGTQLYSDIVLVLLAQLYCISFIAFTKLLHLKPAE